MSEITKHNAEINEYSDKLFNSIAGLINEVRKRVAVSLNTETTLLFWSIGNYINTELKATGRVKYGSKILATLSQQLSWSHLIELSAIEIFKQNKLNDE